MAHLHTHTHTHKYTQSHPKSHPIVNTLTLTLTLTHTHVIHTRILTHTDLLFYVKAPCEAEAQCAALCRAGLVFATATEDMDALTFQTPVLLRHMTMSAAKKLKIQEFHYDKVLEGLEISSDQVGQVFVFFFFFFFFLHPCWDFNSCVSVLFDLVL